MEGPVKWVDANVGDLVLFSDGTTIFDSKVMRKSNDGKFIKLDDKWYDTKPAIGIPVYCLEILEKKTPR